MTRNEMQKQLKMDLKVRLTESQYEVLKTLANALGDTPDEWLHSAVIGGLESDIDLYFGASKTIKEMLFRMAGVKYGWRTNYRRTRRPTNYYRSLYGRQRGSQENAMLRKSGSKVVEQSRRHVQV